MSLIKYVSFHEIEPAEFLPLLNKQSIRAHLIDHELFDANSVRKWIQSKLEVDLTEGCRVRAVVVDEQLAGWCGIQTVEGKYEIAIVIDDRFWGLGKKVFREVLIWAKELRHKTIYVHFLHTRPVYKFLRNLSRNVTESEIMGRKFTTYELELN